MSLQDIFREYYGKAKDVDIKAQVNSAKTSINSFSSLLEKRRQDAADKKKQAAEEALKSEKMKAQGTDSTLS